MRAFSGFLVPDSGRDGRRGGARGCRRTGEDRTDPKEMTLSETPIANKHHSPHPTPLLLTVVEAARLLGVGRSTAYELLASGELESVHIGRSRRVPLAAVEEFVTTLRATPAVRQNGARRIGPAARRFGPGSSRTSARDASVHGTGQLRGSVPR